MIEVARRDHPGPRFEVGSMTDLDLDDASMAGVLAWYSLIHVPDGEVTTALAHLARVLRPGGVALLGFHVGDEHRLKTQGYGGHPMKVHVHLRAVDTMAAWLVGAGLVVEASIVRDPGEAVPQGRLLARRPQPDQPDQPVAPSGNA